MVGLVLGHPGLDPNVEGRPEPTTALEAAVEGGSPEVVRSESWTRAVILNGSVMKNDIFSLVTLSEVH